MYGFRETHILGRETAQKIDRLCGGAIFRPTVSDQRIPGIDILGIILLRAPPIPCWQFVTHYQERGRKSMFSLVEILMQ